MCIPTATPMELRRHAQRGQASGQQRFRRGSGLVGKLLAKWRASALGSTVNTALQLLRSRGATPLLVMKSPPIIVLFGDPPPLQRGPSGILVSLSVHGFVCVLLYLGLHQARKVDSRSIP